MRVLLVDDEPDLRASLAMALEESYEVVTAEHGGIALERLAAEAFDVVLLDLMMPVVTGEEVVLRLRELGHRVPIVVVSAAQDLAATCARLGISFYLQKPFRLPNLLATIDAAIAGR